MTDPVYLLTGEPFLADEALDRLRVEVGAGELSEDSFDATAEPAELLAALETPSLLGDTRLVIVHEADGLKKDQIEALERYLGSPSPHAILVLVAAGKTKLDKTVKSAGSIIGLDAPKGRRLVGWIRQRAGEHGLKVDDRAGWALIDSVGNELRDLDAALTQLATQHGSGARIGASEVRDAFSRLADQRIFAFTDAVGDRRLPVAMGSLRRLLEQGDEPLLSARVPNGTGASDAPSAPLCRSRGEGRRRRVGSAGMARRAAAETGEELPGGRARQRRWRSWLQPTSRSKAATSRRRLRWNVR